MNEPRVEIFRRALETMVGAADGDATALFTDDVTAWSPAINVSSLLELREVLGERDDALSNVTVDIRSMNGGGSSFVAEWRLDADHTGDLVLDEELTVPATGRHVHIGGATFAEFRDDKIRALRSYYDEGAMTEQLLSSA